MPFTPATTLTSKCKMSILLGCVEKLDELTHFDEKMGVPLITHWF
jgi:hypothetical protein